MQLILVNAKGKLEKYEVSQLPGTYRYKIVKVGVDRVKNFDVVGPDRCSCESYTFRKKCKHLTWFRAFGLVPPAEDSTPPPPKSAALLSD